MKKIYVFLVFLFALHVATAQTNPAVQSIPYSQDFTGLTHGSTTYPAGWQGWTTSTSPGAVFNTNTPTADRALTANSSASVNSGNVHNYNGKIGFLNTGSLDLSLVLALDATGKSNIQVVYDIMTIRNPYNGAADTRINEVTLQYRVGTSGSFTNLTGIEYQNNTTLQTGSGVTTPQNLQNKIITLPAACDGQPIVQVRWASRQVSGSGARPSFAVDNITVAENSGSLSIINVSPANGSTGVPLTVSAVATFSANVIKGTGNIVVKRVADNFIVQTIDVTTPAVSVNNNQASFTISGLANSTAYYVEMDAGTFTDGVNVFGGISGSGTWSFTTVLPPPGGIIGMNYSFNTCSGSFPDGFTQYSVIGPQVWGCTTFGRDPSNPTLSMANGVQMNGFSGTNIPNEDWFISPVFDLTATAFPLLSFWSRTKFNGAPLKLKISTDYPGSGNPAGFTWTDLNGKFPEQTSDIWTLSNNINLSAFKTSGVYFAFVYYSSDDDGARWTLDDIMVTNSPTPPPPSITASTLDLQFGFVASPGSITKTFTITGNDLTGDITLGSTTNFTLADNPGGPFNSTLVLTQAASNNITRTVYARFSPPVNNQNFSGTITVSTPGAGNVSILLHGTSIDPVNTLEVVNWNIEWFGGTAYSAARNNQQQANVQSILQNIGADIYGLTEIVDTSRLAAVVANMPGYTYVVSNFGSHTNTSANPASNYTSAQKLAYVYKTSVFTNVATTPLLSQGINSAADISNPAYNYFSSGRFPYMLTADVTLNGITQNVKFVLIHGKANTAPTLTSYNRRKSGSDTLHQTLNSLYPNDKIIFIGDYNDDLDSTITDGITPRITSYSAFTNDNNNFFAPTLALSLANKKSTVSYNDVIDHAIVSNEMACFYMPGTANILTDVTNMVSNYGNTTSDHYPVFTRYSFDQGPNVVATPSSATICNGSAITDIVLSSNTSGTTYTWTRDNTATVTGIAGSGSGSPISGTLTNTTNGPVTVTFTITPTANGCLGTTSTATVLVNPTATVDPVSNLVFCNGATTTAVNFSSPTTGGSIDYNWTNSLPSIGLAASGTGNLPGFVATNATNAPVTATITVTPSYTNGGVTCTGTALIFTITINPTPDVQYVPGSNQVICNGTASQAVTFSSTATGGSLIFNWTNSLPAIGLSASGSGNLPSFTAINTGTVPVTATITVASTYTNAGVSCTGPSASFTITVNPTPTVNAQANQTVCIGAAVTAAFSGSVAGTVYNWTNSNPAIGLAAAGTGNLNFTATNTTTAAISGTITVTPSYTNGGTTCTGSPINFTITVNPTPTVNAQANQTVCSGATVTASFSGSVAGTVYNWTNSNPAIGLAAAGAGNLNFTATNSTSAAISGSITVTPSYTNGGTTCTGSPINFTVTVNPTPTVNAQANQTVCIGAAVTAAFSGSVAGTVYNWTNSNPAIGLAAAGTGNLNFTATNTTTAAISGTIAVTPSYTNGGTTCTGSPINFTITVNPTPTVNAQANQTVCSGATVTASFSGSVAGTVYNWTNSNPAIGLAAAGAGNLNFTATNSTSAAISGTITVTPGYTNGGTTCTGSPINFTITVNPMPTVNSVTNQSVCNGAATTAVIFSGAVSGTVFNWTNNNTSIGLASAGSNSIPSFTAVNSTGSPVTATITVTPAYTNGGVTCTGTPLNFTITVNPGPAVNQPGNQVVCEGSQTAAINFSSPVTGTVFSWTNNNTAIGLAASGTGNIAAFTAANGTSAPITATIMVTPSVGGCTGTPVSFTITVNPTPAVNVVSNQTLCVGQASAAIVFTGAPAGTTFTWTNNNTGIGLAASGTGNIASFIAANATSGTITATITVTPSYQNAGVSCTGVARTFIITVNPVPNIIFTGIPPRVCLTDSIVRLDNKVSPSGGIWSGPGVTGGNFNAKLAGTGVHRISYSVSNGIGCTSTWSENITVNDCIERHQSLATAIKIMSNPSRGRFNIRFNSDRYTEFNLRVVDASGREYRQQRVTGLRYGSVIPINLAELAGGTYFLQVYTDAERAHFPIVIIR